MLNLLLGVKDILLVEDSMAELLVINGLSQVGLDTVLHNRHGKDLVHIGSQSLICVKKLRD